jgi:hypothetical protein
MERIEELKKSLEQPGLSSAAQSKIRRQIRNAERKLAVKNKKSATEIPQEIKYNIRGDAERVGAKRDPMCVPGQNYFLLSYVAPEESRQKNRKVYMKMRGAFNTVEEADKYAKELWDKDPDFDIFIVDAYEWIPIPLPMSMNMQVPMKYNQEELDKFMSQHYKNVEKGNKDIQERIAQSKRAAHKKLAKMGLAPAEPLTDEMRESSQRAGEIDPSEVYKKIAEKQGEENQSSDE